MLENEKAAARRRIYKNVALTADQVRQNFNATRTRFGI
jgi:hypothetical protein